MIRGGNANWDFGAETTSLRANLGRAARFWEPLRIAYNLVLVGVAAAWVIETWPHFQPALKFSSILPMSGLALMANVLYCAAYFVDVPLQRATWKSLRRGRWILWAAGMLFAIVLSSYWIVDEIYPDFR
ncbi:MAG TPA: hypothetical protein VMJ35_11690 [Dongiaceae bacterium]|nr:hypothetical protein [Dongiaceae bacterium]